MKSNTSTICLLATLICFLTVTHAQDNTYYTPMKDDPALHRQWMTATEQRYKNDVAALNGRYKKDFEALYKERWENIRRMYSEKEIITAGHAATYLQELAKAIIQANPALGSLDTRIVFSRAWWPNASSMGEGTIIVNIGLFNRLRNESQAAFVLCHELAHLYLNHSNKSIERYVNTINSQEFQKELKRIKQSEYQKNQRAEALLKNLAFRSRRHSREHEHEADSLAVEWLRNTFFDIREALTCLALLDSADSDKHNTDPALEQVFHFQEYPFQARWVKKEESLFSALAARHEEESKPERDSLKTHPDCTNRIKKLEASVASWYKAGSRLFVINESLFNQLQQEFDYEIIEHCFRTGNISRSLYYSLQMLPERRNDPYLVTNIGRCLNELYKAQKAHTLSKIVDLPAPYHDKKYDKLLRFIQELRLKDIAAISYYFLLPWQKAFTVHEEFATVFNTSKQHYNRP